MGNTNETSSYQFIKTIQIPDLPGCYLFRDQADRVIYIGKAKNLKKRVYSYFKGNDNSLDPKTRQLVKHIAGLDFIVTANEVEALILESNLIKRHTPKYNIDLKDSRNFAYLHITSETFPRLLVAREKTGKGEFFGPFVSSQIRDQIRAVVNKTFKIRTCKRMPSKACLRFRINICSAPCTGHIAANSYAELVARAKLVLKGHTKELIHNLEKEMKNASAEMNYEYALELRNQIEAVQRLQERQNMDRRKLFDEDIVNYQVKDGKVFLMLFNVYKGTLENKREFEFDYSADFFEEFLVRYYSDHPIPKEIIVPDPVDDSVVDYLKTLREKSVIIKVPERGEKKQLLELVRKNIDLSFFGAPAKVKDLQRRLRLEQSPEVIECFDISHLSGTAMVASMVQFRGGRPDKSNYRRFRIRTVEGIDDTAAIAEVVNRRYTRLLRENLALPGLIVIDGGRGQLNAALEQLQELQLDIPIISIAKQFEEIYTPAHDQPFRFSRRSPALQLVQQIRDETHRFAITYNRLLRKKDLLKSRTLVDKE